MCSILHYLYQTMSTVESLLTKKFAPLKKNPTLLVLYFLYNWLVRNTLVSLHASLTFEFLTAE